MIERASKLAERLADRMSRRGFMGWVGKGALGLAAVVGGILGTPLQGHAVPPVDHCCVFLCRRRPLLRRTCQQGNCPNPEEGCRLVSDKECECPP